MVIHGATFALSNGLKIRDIIFELVAVKVCNVSSTGVTEGTKGERGLDCIFGSFE